MEFSLVYRTEGSQELLTGPYSWPTESKPHPEHLLRANCNIILKSTFKVKTSLFFMQHHTRKIYGGVKVQLLGTRWW
jgi:hypothetical protein